MKDEKGTNVSSQMRATAQDKGSGMNEISNSSENSSEKPVNGPSQSIIQTGKKFRFY